MLNLPISCLVLNIRQLQCSYRLLDFYLTRSCCYDYDDDGQPVQITISSSIHYYRYLITLEFFSYFIIIFFLFTPRLFWTIDCVASTTKTIDTNTRSPLKRARKQKSSAKSVVVECKREINKYKTLSLLVLDRTDLNLTLFLGTCYLFTWNQLLEPDLSTFDCFVTQFFSFFWISMKVDYFHPTWMKRLVDWLVTDF